MRTAWLGVSVVVMGLGGCTEAPVCEAPTGEPGTWTDTPSRVIAFATSEVTGAALIGTSLYVTALDVPFRYSDPVELGTAALDVAVGADGGGLVLDGARAVRRFEPSGDLGPAQDLGLDATDTARLAFDGEIFDVVALGADSGALTLTRVTPGGDRIATVVVAGDVARCGRGSFAVAAAGPLTWIVWAAPHPVTPERSLIRALRYLADEPIDDAPIELAQVPATCPVPLAIATTSAETEAVVLVRDDTSAFATAVIPVRRDGSLGPRQSLSGRYDLIAGLPQSYMLGRVEPGFPRPLRSTYHYLGGSDLQSSANQTVGSLEAIAASRDEIFAIVAEDRAWQTGWDSRVYAGAFISDAPRGYDLVQDGIYPAGACAP